MRLKKIIFHYDIFMMSQTRYDTHSEEVINRARFDVLAYLAVLDELKNRHTNRIVELYILDKYCLGKDTRRKGFAIKTFSDC